MVEINHDTKLIVSNQTHGLSLRDIVYILYRRRWVVLAVAIPIIFLAGSSLFRQTGSFTASAKVVVELTKVDLPQWNVNSRNIDFDRELSTLFTIAMSIPVAERAATALQDSLQVIESLDPNLVGLKDSNNFAEYLLGGLDVSVIGESNVLEFRFSSVDPRISLMSVGALRDAFLEYQIHGRKNTKAVQFYEEQMHNVRTKLDSLLSRRGNVLLANNYISLKDELKYDSGNLADMKNELNKTTVNRKAMAAQYAQLFPFLNGDPRDFPMGPDENRCHSLIYWRNLVGKHDDEMASILTVYKEDSDAAKRQQELINDTLDKLGNEERSYVQSIQVALETLRGKEYALLEEIQGIQAKSRKAPFVYQQVSLIDTEISSLRGLLDDIQGKLGEVRLSEFADERVSNVQRLSDPELSSILSGSKTMIYFVLIIVFALALGVVIAFVLDSMDHRIYDSKDVEGNLKLPVFSSVTRVD